jgi:hypothetical protein
MLERIGIAGGAAAHYPIVLGFMLVVQILSVVWFARNARSRGGRPPRNRDGDCRI